jgi:hypothetical protein
VYDLTSRTEEDWEPRIGRTKYLRGEGFDTNAEDTLYYPEWENISSDLSLKIRARFTQSDLYDQLIYLLDGLERICESGTEVQNINYQPGPKPKPNRNFPTAKANFLLISQSLGVYVTHVPPGTIIDHQVVYEDNYKINYKGLAGVLNRCAPFSETRITPDLVQSHIDDLWKVLLTKRKSSVGKPKHLVTNLKRPSQDDLSTHYCKKQKEI